MRSDQYAELVKSIEEEASRFFADGAEGVEIAYNENAGTCSISLDSIHDLKKFLDMLDLDECLGVDEVRDDPWVLPNCCTVIIPVQDLPTVLKNFRREYHGVYPY